MQKIIIRNIDNNKNKYIFIIHTEHTLNNFTDLHEDIMENSQLVRAVRLREKIPFFGENKESWELSHTEWRSCFHTTQIFQEVLIAMYQAGLERDSASIQCILDFPDSAFSTTLKTLKANHILTEDVKKIFYENPHLESYLLDTIIEKLSNLPYDGYVLDDEDLEVLLSELSIKKQQHIVTQVNKPSLVTSAFSIFHNKNQHIQTNTLSLDERQESISSPSLKNPTNKS